MDAEPRSLLDLYEASGDEDMYARAKPLYEQAIQAHPHAELLRDYGYLSVVEPGDAAGDPVGGFSILQADDIEALVKVLDGHPHAAMGGTIEILQFLSMPGM